MVNAIRLAKGASGFEKKFVIFVFLLSSGAFLSLWTVPGRVQDAAGSTEMQIVWMSVYLVSLCLFFTKFDNPVRTFLFPWPLVVLCIFAITSCLWSQEPWLSLRRSIALVMALLIGTYFSSRFTFREQFRLLVWTCGTCMVSSFIFEILNVGTTVDSGESVAGWYGIFDQKNGLGRMMVFSSLIFFFWKKMEPEHGLLANLGLAGSVALVVLSQSETAGIILVLLFFGYFYLRWILRKGMTATVVGLASLGACGVGFLIYGFKHLDTIASLLGKSVTLTGRLQLWVFATVMALRRPWLGYGYNAFWLEGQESTRRIWHAMGKWEPPHAHNAFLEIWLELGLIGVIFFYSVFTYYVIRSFGYARKNPSSPTALWPLMFLLFQFFSTLTEAGLLERSLFFIVFVSAVFVTHRNNSEYQGRDSSSFNRETSALAQLRKASYHA